MNDPQEPSPQAGTEAVEIDRDIVDRFRVSGEGWERRLNDVLREAAGLAVSGLGGRRPEDLNAANDD